MISGWCELTDRFGDEICFERDSVKRFYSDSMVIPDAQNGKRTIFGTMLIFDNGGDLFAVADYDAVKEIVCAVD